MKLNQETFFQLVFLIIFVVLLFAFFTTNPRPYTSFIFTSAFSVFYFFWGITYHASRKDLNKEVLLEYASIALLVFLIGFFVLAR